jgi:hypothetical protein
MIAGGIELKVTLNVKFGSGSAQYVTLALNFRDSDSNGRMETTRGHVTVGQLERVADV